jgi:amphi-Trp domain-containing protein
MSDNSIELRKVIEIRNAVEYLEALVAGLKAGNIVVEQGERKLTLSPPPIVELQIEAKQKKAKGKFVMELQWKSGAVEDVEESMQISSQVPESSD